jgi:rhamnogalacturonyl hydrolase YesR
MHLNKWSTEMDDDSEIFTSLKNLKKYVKENDYSGIDPYDALNSTALCSLNRRMLRLISTQILVYSPLNLRNFLDIEPGRNSKAIGLFLQAYCRLYQQHLIEKEQFEDVTTELVEFLLQNQAKGYSGDCWGFNFNWQDLYRYAEKNLPTVVITSFVAHAFLDLYDITKNKKYLESAQRSCEFIMKDLHITRTEKGICFSYTPIDTSIVHNANALGASLLARVFSYTGEKKFLEYASQAFDFLLSNQKQDGSWAYSVELKTGKERNQIDFHQGFILDSLCGYIRYISPQDTVYVNALSKGAEFYIKHQFDNAGKSYWRLPQKWPIDIHNQAQGIITGCRLYDVLKEKRYRDFSKTIVEWTLQNMQHPSGFFYYQKWPLVTNKIPYMRWGQAWMMLALSEYLANPTSKGGNS